jgi:hypothetical protein
VSPDASFASFEVEGEPVTDAQLRR